MNRQRNANSINFHSAFVVIVGDDAQNLAFAAREFHDAEMNVVTIAAITDLPGTMQKVDAREHILLVTEPVTGKTITQLTDGLVNDLQLPFRLIALAGGKDPEMRQLFLGAGVDSILEMPKDDPILVRTVRAAVHHPIPPRAIARYIGSHKSSIGRLIQGVFEIRTLVEAERLSTMLGLDHPDPQRFATGIWELLSNGIEHGNLEIDYAQKRELLMQGKFAEEVERRLTVAPYATRHVRVSYRRHARQINLRVEDDGQGFDFSAFLGKGITLDGPNGRGIFISAHHCFDKLRYVGKGNIVEAVTRI